MGLWAQCLWQLLCEYDPLEQTNLYLIKHCISNRSIACYHMRVHRQNTKVMAFIQIALLDKTKSSPKPST